MIPALHATAADRCAAGSAPQGLRRTAILCLALLCLWQLAIWTSAATLAYRAPEIDSAEQFVWSFSMENGYWKHPPLPTWLMHAMVGVFGPSVALPMIATQVSMVVALLLLWRLALEFMSAERATVAVALTSLITYFNVDALSFNHSTVLMPFLAATVLAYRLATSRASLHWWALAGALAGLSMLVKYLALLQVASLVLAFALDRSLHRRRQFAGMALAMLVCALVLLPHALWLQRTDFLPLRYASSVAQADHGFVAALASTGQFMAIQLLRLLPMLVAAWLVLRKAARSPGTGAAPARPAAHERRFLWIVSCVPLVLMLGYALATGTELQSRWGSGDFLFTGILLLALWRVPVDGRALRSTALACVSMHLLLCLGSTLGQTVLAERLHRGTRANFPGDLLARNALQTWRSYTSAPLRLVASDIWLGGNVIANSPHQKIAVLIDGHHFKSPWVRLRAVDACGALILDDTTVDAAGHGNRNPALDELMDRADATGTWELPWAYPDEHSPGAVRGHVRWGVILPRESGACPL